MAVLHVAESVFRPRRHRPVVMAVEGAVVEPFRFKEDHRVRVLDGRYQKALRIGRIGRHHDLQARDMGEQRLRALAMRLAAEDAAAGRHAHDDRAGELAVGAIAQPRRFRDDLVIGRIDIVGELHLDAGAQPIGGHADRRADDAKLADRRVEAATGSVFLLQALRAAEHAAEIADILAEDDDVVVARHGHIHRAADRLDHGHPRHGLDPRLLALAPQMRRHGLVDALEHVARRRLAARMQRAMFLGFLLRGDHSVEHLGLGLLVPFFAP